ncbi:MAG: alpha/beta hydrolase [Planctomycetota bacterium]|nr:alpha/beta hydrolase [Planctomycetota bacterium]
MADEPVKQPVPPALRISLTGVLLVTLLLLGVRYMNAANLYPGVVNGAEAGPALARERNDVREVEFTTADGVKLYGWVQGDDAAPRKIIQFMGNGEQVGPAAELYAASCKALNAQFLLFDYRGFGASEGKPSEPGLYADARAAHAFAVDQLKWRPESIILWGRSLGGGPAIKLAAELAENPPAALILEAPFTSVRDMASLRLAHLGKPEWLVYDLYDNLSRAPGLKLPVFHFHGDADEIIPYAQGEQLFAALPGPKQHLALPGAGHNDIWSDETRAALIRARINEFLGAHE